MLVGEDLKAGAMGPLCWTDKARAFDEGDLAARAVGPVELRKELKLMVLNLLLLLMIQKLLMSENLQLKQ